MKKAVYLLLIISLLIPAELNAHSRKHRHTHRTHRHRAEPFIPSRKEVVLIKGVSYIKLQRIYFAKHLIIHVMKVNMNVPGISLEPGLADNNVNRLWPINMITKQHGAVAAINGSFFNPAPAHPIGRLIRNGCSIYKEDKIFPRSVFGITYNNEPFIQIPYISDTLIFNNDTHKKLIISGINQPRQYDDVMIYTSAYGQTTRTNDYGDEVVIENSLVKTINRRKGNAQIPAKGFIVSLNGLATNYTDMFSVGATVNMSFDQDTAWQNVKHAISGGPRLLEGRKNVVHPYFSLENFHDSFTVPRARTAVGINTSGEVLLVVVEKTRASNGITFSELAEIMKDFDCVDAMALDGGSSSAIYINPAWYKIKGSCDLPYINNALMVTKQKR